MSDEAGSRDRRRQIDALPETQLRQLFVEVRDYIVLRDAGPAAVANERDHDPNTLPRLLEVFERLGEHGVRDVIEQSTLNVSDEDFARLIERASENWQYSDGLVRERREAVARRREADEDAALRNQGWWPFGKRRAT